MERVFNHLKIKIKDNEKRCDWEYQLLRQTFKNVFLYQIFYKQLFPLSWLKVCILHLNICLHWRGKCPVENIQINLVWILVMTDYSMEIKTNLLIEGNVTKGAKKLSKNDKSKSFMEFWYSIRDFLPLNSIGNPEETAYVV